jgi:hypothetical protein
MSKLDVILLQCANDVLDLPATNDPLGKPIDDAKAQIKDLFLSDELLEGLLTEEEYAVYTQRVNDL